MAKETPYFSHDYGARNDPKLQKLQMKMGMEGLGIYWCLVEISYEQEGLLHKQDIISYAFQLRVDVEKINQILSNFELFILDSETENIYSKTLIERLKKRFEKSEKATKSAKKRWEKYENEQNTNASKNDTNASKNDTNAFLRENTTLTNGSIGSSSKNDTNASKNDTNASKNDTNASKNDAIKNSKGKNSKRKNSKENTLVVLQPRLDYQFCVEFWLKQFHVGWTFRSVHGKSMKSIIEKIKESLKQSNKEPTVELILDSFKLICLKLPEWFKDKDLNVIDSKYNEIITQIKNSQNGHNNNRNESVFRKAD